MTEPVEERGRYLDDDGNELNPDLIPRPALCISCDKNDNGDPEEEILCNLNRLDQQDEPEFRCDAYEPKRVT